MAAVVSVAAVVGGLGGLAIAAGLGLAICRGGARLNLRTFFTVLNVLLQGFGAYLMWRGVEEVGERAGGELGEIAAPIAALTYAATLLWLLLRRRTTGAAAAA